VELIGLAALGGGLALDGTSVGQFMLSRPLVAGTITGWLLGDPATGFLLGAVLEMYLLVSFPTGGARFPEGATATVVAVSCASFAVGPGSLPLAAAAGLLWGQVGGLSITGLRKLNGHLVPEPFEPGIRPARVVRAQAAGVVLDFLRGSIVTLAGVAIGRPVVAYLSGSWPMGPAESLALVLLGAAVSTGILLRDFGGFRSRRFLFVAGFALGVLGMRFL